MCAAVEVVRSRSLGLAPISGDTVANMRWLPTIATATTVVATLVILSGGFRRSI